MNEREQLLLRAATERLQPFAAELIKAGWRPELIVFGPGEIDRIIGYKVAIVVPVDMTWSTSTDLVPVPSGMEARCECGTLLEWNDRAFAYRQHDCARRLRAA